MANQAFTWHEGKLRFYDWGSPRKYVEFAFVAGGFTAPIGRPTTEERPEMDRGRHGPLTHMIEGDDAPVLAALDISFTLGLKNFEPNFKKWMDALNLLRPDTWVVGADTWITTKGQSQLRAGGTNGALHNTPLFRNSRRRTGDLYFMQFDVDGANDLVYGYREVEFPPGANARVSEAGEGNSAQVTGKWWGAFEVLADFPAGQAS